MDLVRLALYVIGFVGAVGVAGVLFRTRNLLARLLGVAMLVWAVVCGSLAAMLVSSLFFNDPRPRWADLLWLLDSILLAVVPLALYSLMLRNSHAGSN